jgi:hypothetical protein
MTLTTVNSPVMPKLSIGRTGKFHTGTTIHTHTARLIKKPEPMLSADSIRD